MMADIASRPYGGSPSRWSFAGGWLNHPAVTVDYSAAIWATP